MKNNIKKSISGLLIMLSGLTTYGQIYDVVINGRMNPISADLEYTGVCRVFGGIDFELDVYRGDPQPFFYDREVVSGFSDITLNVSYNSYPIATSCQFSQWQTFSEEEAVGTSYAAQVSAFCASGTLYVDFFPRVAIQRTGPNAGSTEICAGDVLQLTTTEGGFPDLIYNWQYRLPDTFGWIDVPAATTGARGISFTIGQLLGQDHMDYLGEDIVFRLGNSSRQFGNGYRVTYSACGPLVDNIEYTPPACSGDPVNVAVNFNEPLAGSLADGIQNGDERLSTIYIVDALDSSLFFAQANQVNMDVNGGTTFTFNNVSGLTEDRAYNVRYQVERRINNQWQLRGFIESPPGESFTYVNPPPLVFNSPPVWGAAECFGESSGSLILHVSGGTGSYRYQIDGTGPWTTFTPHASNPATQTLSPGPHTVRVRDANNCEISNIGTVGQPVGITFSSSPAFPSTTYNGGSDANITISNVQEGSGGYSFNWTKQGGDPGFPRTTQSLVEISAGTYTLTITDSNGCSVTQDFTVAEPPQITISSEIGNVLCSGGNGTINVNVEGGIPGYTYEWFKENELTGIFETTSITTSNITASAGTYHVRITDNGGSGHTVTSENYTINEPEDLQFSTTITDVHCRGESTGSIDLTITGGTTPYTVSWERDGSVYSTDQDLSGLRAGVYTLTLTAPGGCTPINNGSDFIIEITEPGEAVEIEKLTHINNNIYGGSIGELEIVASGGTSGYAYSWTRNGNPFTPPTGSTDTHLVNLPAGDYEVGVTHAGCTVRLSATITEPDLLEIASAVPTHVNCFGESTGSITLTVTGGIPPYHYQWSKLDDDDFSAPDTNEITGLSQGTYEVTVTDESGSPAATSTTVIISQQPQIQITHTNEDNICYNDNQGSIDLTVTGGVPPYSYQWSNGETTQDISGLQSGSYTVEVTDALGCESNYDVTIGQPADAVGLIFDVSQITAYGYNNGAIDITVTGGAPPYVYEWIANNGFASANEDISGLEPGDYTLIVYDANYETSGSVACTVMEEFEIREPAELLVNISEEYSLFCYGDQNGELLANVTGGVTPYSYQWYRVENGITLDQNIQTPFITDIGQGNYRVVITDDNGIEVTSEDYQLSHPDELILQTISTTNVLCYGDATGAIDMQVSGGVIPHTITWNDGATTLDRENLTAGIYTITVEDANGCSKETTVEIIHPYQELRIEQVDVTDVTRFDGSDGSLSVAFSGGASPHGITWTRESTQTIQGNTAIITNLVAGDYTVVLTDANGCSVSQTYSITEPDIVEATLINPTCAGLCDASLSLAILERPGNYTYTWDNGSTSSTLTGLCAGTYTVLIGGFGDRILERTYEIIDPAPLVVDLGEDRVLCQGQTHSVNAAIADAGALYQWTSDTGFSSASPQVELTQPGTYSLTVTSSLGCIGTDAITISRTTAVIGAEFAVSSQVFTGKSVVLVDLSNPTPDVIEWILPEGAEVVTSETGYAEVVFKEAGEYVFGMYAELGECHAYQEKRVVVIEREKFTEGEEDDISENGRNSLIENYVVYPNPSDGAFTLEIGLSEEKPVSVRIFGLVNNAMVDYRNLQNNKDYLVEYDLRHVSAGIYFIVLETPVSTQVKKLIIE